MRVLLVLAPGLLLAGCVDPFAPTIDCRDYLAEHTGEGEFVVFVTLEPGGPPVEGASIAVQAWGTCWQRNERASTGSDGSVSWRFPAWGVANVDVIADGFTVESVERVPLAGDNVSFAQTIPVFHERLSWQDSGAYSSSGAGVLPVVGGDASFISHDIEWDASQEALDGYARRIVRLDVGLAWNNTRTSFADLGIGIGPSADRLTVINAEADQKGPGAFTETASISATGMYRAGWTDATGLVVGPLSEDAHIALTGGVPYKIWIEAFFSSPRGADAPFPVVVGLAALILAAVVAQRRRER